MSSIFIVIALSIRDLALLNRSIRDSEFSHLSMGPMLLFYLLISICANFGVQFINIDNPGVQDATFYQGVQGGLPSGLLP